MINLREVVVPKSRRQNFHRKSQLKFSIAHPVSRIFVKDLRNVSETGAASAHTVTSSHFLCVILLLSCPVKHFCHCRIYNQDCEIFAGA